MNWTRTTWWYVIPKNRCVLPEYSVDWKAVSPKLRPMYSSKVPVSGSGIRTKTARRHGLNTDASFRFKRGTTIRTSLFMPSNGLPYWSKNWAAERLRPKSSTSTGIRQPISKVEVKYAHIDRLIGKKNRTRYDQKILNALEIKIVKEDTEGSLADPPYRVDVLAAKQTWSRIF